MSTSKAVWSLAVLEAPSGSTPVVGLQPADCEQHGQSAVRLKRAGFRSVRGNDWDRGVWPLAPTRYVDVVQGELVRFTTGTASFYVGDNLQVNPMWSSAARERRAVIVLVPAGTLGPADDPTVSVWTVDVWKELAHESKVLAALGVVRFDVFTGARPTR